MMKKKQWMAIIRHALTFVGGVLVTQGVIDKTLFIELSGAVMTLIGGIWSIIDKNEPIAVEQNKE